jgi:Flp pilus assembly protein TadG
MFRKLITRFRRIGDAGAAAVEFAFTAPALILIVLGVADYGKLMNTASLLFGSTRAGAEYVLANWNNPQVNTVAGAKQQVCTFFTLNGGSCSSVTPSLLYGSTGVCTCATSGVSQTCPGPAAPNPCGTDRLLYYVGVQASYPFSPVFMVSNFLGLGTFNFPPNQSASGGTLAPTTWVRVQ